MANELEFCHVPDMSFYYELVETAVMGCVGSFPMNYFTGLNNAQRPLRYVPYRGKKYVVISEDNAHNFGHLNEVFVRDMSMYELIDFLYVVGAVSGGASGVTLVLKRLQNDVATFSKLQQAYRSSGKSLWERFVDMISESLCREQKITQ